MQSLYLYHPINILLGIGLLVITVLVHMMALMTMRERLHHLPVPKNRRHHVIQESMVATVVVMLLSFVHIFEVVVWATAYVSAGAIKNLDDAVYFSMTTYTTVGPMGVDIVPSFRGIAGFESLIGPVMVAWSTAFLVEAVSQIRNEFLAQQKHPRPH